jgi:hypothetical protein
VNDSTSNASRREQCGDPSTSDALIDEVRAIRKQISEQFGNNVDRLIDHLQDIERAHHGKVVEPDELVARSHPARGASE